MREWSWAGVQRCRLVLTATVLVAVVGASAWMVAAAEAGSASPHTFEGTNALPDGTRAPDGAIVEVVNESGVVIAQTAVHGQHWEIGLAPGSAQLVTLHLLHGTSLTYAVIGGQSTFVGFVGPGLAPARFHGSDATINRAPAPDGTLIQAVDLAGEVMGQTRVLYGRWDLAVDPEAGRVRILLGGVQATDWLWVLPGLDETLSLSVSTTGAAWTR